MADRGLGIGESVLMSLSGIILVFTILAVLAAATLLAARLLSRLAPVDSRDPAQRPAAASPAPAIPPPDEAEDPGEVLAVLHGALSMASGIPIDQMVIVSVTSRSAD